MNISGRSSPACASVLQLFTTALTSIVYWMNISLGTGGPRRKERKNGPTESCRYLPA